MEDVDVVILSVPLQRLPDLAPGVRALEDDVVVIDTSNYYPQRDALRDALARAEVARLPRRRDLAVAAIQERVGDAKTNPDADYGVRLCRALFL